ncbi:hypothetical protein Tco_0407228 [Tanacetum coccineum]
MASQKLRTIEESNNLTTLSLDELIGNLKVYEEVIKKDSKTVKSKRKQSRSIALKARKESSDDDSSDTLIGDRTTTTSKKEHSFNPYTLPKYYSLKENKDDQKMAMANEMLLSVEIQIISSENRSKLSKYQNQGFVGGSWSDSDKDKEEKTKEEKYLMAKASKEDYSMGIVGATINSYKAGPFSFKGDRNLSWGPALICTRYYIWGLHALNLFVLSSDELGVRVGSLSGRGGVTGRLRIDLAADLKSRPK